MLPFFYCHSFGRWVVWRLFFIIVIQGVSFALAPLLRRFEEPDHPHAGLLQLLLQCVMGAFLRSLKRGLPFRCAILIDFAQFRRAFCCLRIAPLISQSWARSWIHRPLCFFLHIFSLLLHGIRLGRKFFSFVSSGCGLINRLPASSGFLF